MGGVDAFHQLQARRESDRPDDTLFRYNHEPGFRELLKSLDLYTDPSSGMTRNTKSLRVTGINLRLLKNPGVPLNDLKAFAARGQGWVDIEGIIFRQTGALDWTYVDQQITPLAALKDEPEILTGLARRREEFER